MTDEERMAIAQDQNSVIHAKLAAAEAALAEMSRDRNRWCDLAKMYESDRNAAERELDTITEECNAARARAERLAEALRPFAESANGFPDDWENDVGLYLYYISKNKFEITIGHCRAARAARAEPASGDGTVKA